MGSVTRAFLFGTSFLMIVVAFLVAASIIVPFWIKIDMSGEMFRRGVYWECNEKDLRKTTCSPIQFQNRDCPGSQHGNVEASALRIRYYAVRGLLISTIGCAFATAMVAIVILFVRTRPFKAYCILFGCLFLTFGSLGAAIILYYLTVYRYENCFAAPCDGLTDCSSAISTSGILAIIAAAIALLLLLFTSLGVCMNACQGGKNAKKRRALLEQGLPPAVEKPRYPELMERSSITPHTAIRSALRKEVSEAELRRTSFAKGGNSFLGDIDTSSAFTSRQLSTREESVSSPENKEAIQGAPRPPFALPNRRVNSGTLPPIRKVVTEPFNEATRVPGGNLPNRDASGERSGSLVTSPRSEWIYDRDSGLYWSNLQEVFYDDFSGHFYDPQIERWFDPITSEWYTLE